MEQKKFKIEYTDEELIMEIQDIEKNKKFILFMEGMKLYGKHQQLVEIWNKTNESSIKKQK